MQKISIKSLLLGIGIGIALTSLVHMYIYNGQVISKEQKSNKIVASTDESKRIENKISELKENLRSSVTLSKETTILQEEIQGEVKDPTQQSVEIEIEKGMDSIAIAKKLKEMGLISSTQEFIDLAEKQGATRQLKAGRKVVTIGSSLDEILDVLLKIN